MNFIHNNNIDIVEDVFKDKVSEGMLKHLLSKKQSIINSNKDNLNSWLEFIGRLDAENSEIMFDFINSKNSTNGE